MRAGGYILVETLVAMAVLSITMVTIHNALGQAALTHAQARDFTQARFLLNQKMGDYRLNTALEEGQQSGDFGAALSRFRWQASVSKAPLTALAASADPRAGSLKLTAPFLGKIVITVQWTTGKQPFEERLETLVAPTHFKELATNAAVNPN